MGEKGLNAMITAIEKGLQIWVSFCSNGMEMGTVWISIILDSVGQLVCLYFPIVCKDYLLQEAVTSI